MTSSMNDSFLAKQIKSEFGNISLYDILQVSSNATSSEIKKAYMKLALKYHPDKGGKAETFQALSVVHSILSDEEKRKIYDESGLIENDDEENYNEESAEQNFQFWNEYFRRLFPKLTISQIEKFGKDYIGSKEEQLDILNAYEKCHGNSIKMMELIMFMEDGEEQRLIKIIDHLIEEKKVSSNSNYIKSREKLLKKYEKYIQKVINEQMKDEKGGKKKRKASSSSSSNEEMESSDDEKMEVDDVEDDEDNEEEEEEEEKKQPKKSKKTNAKITSNREKNNDQESLEHLILQKNKKHSSADDLYEQLLSKYSKPSNGKKKSKGKEEPIPDDEEFLKYQKELFADHKKRGLK
jgi:DnaJ family protein C protein 9